MKEINDGENVLPSEINEFILVAHEIFQKYVLKLKRDSTQTNILFPILTVSTCIEHIHNMKFEKGKTCTMVEIKEELNQTNSIEEFYADTVILLTGATGFVGKGLLEKLMRVCPRIAAIFILLRPKRNQTIEERFKKLVDDPVRK
ncbi:hypothetical protein E2986_11758 [Frieseomelitta varia]|uniref:Fatty acyl-CoA reductase n=1 Tax=Frieseomelitta varia TaxID=561572 RepID=A0A833RM90_9HYME|nr:hypothetical protein E2986_11758 [Frieseomelitta varia]